jgi:hypothetical protein
MTTAFISNKAKFGAMSSVLRTVPFGLLLLLAVSPIPAEVNSSSTPAAGSPINEMGRIPILEYHLIQPGESRWGRSVENFRLDLETLYADGFCPISVREFIDGRIEAPAGKKPILFTFDDSSPGQMRYLSDPGGPRIDPECAVGILQSFHQKHPDFPLKGIFFVLPEAKQPHKLFGQPEFEAKKLNELVRLGFELGNHTLWHADLAKYPGPVVQKQLALAQVSVEQRVPGYKFLALSLPMGDWPQEPALAVQGSYKGIEYHHKAVFLVTGGPAPSPFDVNCRFTHLPRIQVTGNELKHWLKYFELHPDQVFVSDGDSKRVTLPKELLPRLARTRFSNLQVTTY